MVTLEDLQAKLQSEIDKFKGMEKEYQKAIGQRQQLDGQLHENKTVKDELDLLKDGSEVYKLVGPVLVKQELVEAKQNVSKRMDYISAQLKTVTDQISTLESKQEAQKEKLTRLQVTFQQEQTKAALKV